MTSHQDLLTLPTEKANQSLRAISAEHGLGVALLAAWRHGLRVGHIPQSLRLSPSGGSADEVCEVKADEVCPHVFVHVPVRQFRSDPPKLIEHGIMNRDADPSLFVYHEDGLVGTFSFIDPGQVGLDKDDLAGILRDLAKQGVLVLANIDNRQIQFKDLAVKRRIGVSGQQVYVRVDRKPLDRRNIRLSMFDRDSDVWNYVKKSLQHRFACNYCSAETLTPKEVIINSTLAGVRGRPADEPATVRNYRMGFTFAPVGNPRQVCHFLAWDFPHVGDLVMNMEPQAYSFSDLIRLVRTFNNSITRFFNPSDELNALPPVYISGGCNHWAGNSIYYQHYQFMCLYDLPLVRHADSSELLVSFQGVDVRKMADAWPAPALLITSAEPDGDEQIMAVADKIAKEWRILSEEDDVTYGNEIVIKNHTQNIFVTTHNGNLTAIFIPRLRQRVSTNTFASIQKMNAGVLEMMGYFVIDNRHDFDKLERMTSLERKKLGDAWLRHLSPGKDSISAFEENVKICLNTDVDALEKRIDELGARLAGSGRGLIRRWWRCGAGTRSWCLSSTASRGR